jgi:hypothetical protein
MRAVYKYWAWIVFGAVCLQVGFAGYGAFYVVHATDNDGVVDEDKFFEGFGAHAIFGYIVGLLILLYLLIAFAAKVGKPRLIRNGALFGLWILQVLLAFIGFGVPAIGFFHPVNALLIFALSGSMAWSYWQESKAVAAPAAPQIAPAE